MADIMHFGILQTNKGLTSLRYDLPLYNKDILLQ